MAQDLHDQIVKDLKDGKFRWIAKNEIYWEYKKRINMDEQEFTKRVLPYVLDNLYRDAEVERVMSEGKMVWAIKS